MQELISCWGQGSGCVVKPWFYYAARPAQPPSATLSGLDHRFGLQRKARSRPNNLRGWHRDRRGGAAGGEEEAQSTAAGGHPGRRVRVAAALVARANGRDHFVARGAACASTGTMRPTRAGVANGANSGAAARAAPPATPRSSRRAGDAPAGHPPCAALISNSCAGAPALGRGSEPPSRLRRPGLRRPVRELPPPTGPAGRGARPSTGAAAAARRPAAAAAAQRAAAGSGGVAGGTSALGAPGEPGARGSSGGGGAAARPGLAARRSARGRRAAQTAAARPLPRDAARQPICSGLFDELAQSSVGRTQRPREASSCADGADAHLRSARPRCNYPGT